MSEPIRRTLTAENQEESRQLRALWTARQKSQRVSQAEFGQTYGIGSQAAVGHFLNGHAAISLKAAKGFAQGLGCEIAAFSPRLAQEASALGEVAGTGACALDLTQLSKDELQLIMLYRSLDKSSQSTLLSDAQASYTAQQTAQTRPAPASARRKRSPSHTD